MGGPELGGPVTGGIAARDAQAGNAQPRNAQVRQSLDARLIAGARRWLGPFGPAMGRRPWPEMARAALGVGLSIALVELGVLALHGSRGSGLFLVSGIASSAVLLFALPNSPLAQPWSAFMGMVLSAAAAVVAVAVVPAPWATGLALCLAAFAMMAARALHPPAAGVALFVVLEAEAGRDLGAIFPLFPLGALMAALIGLAVLWHRAFGQAYPNRLPRRRSAQALGPASASETLGAEALEAILREFRQSANVSAADLARLTEAVAARAAQTLLADTPVRALMRPAIAVPPETPLREVLAKMRGLGLRCLAVTDSEGSLLGMIDQVQLIDALDRAYATPRRWPLRSPPEPQAAQLMDPAPDPVSAELPLAALLARFSAPGAQPVPVLAGGRLAGMVGRSDLVALLLSRAPGFSPPAERPAA